MKETIYVDYSGGHFEAWTYSDGNTVRLTLHDIKDIRKYAKKYGYSICLTEEAQLFENGN
jgi:hypothetical protein